MRGGILTLDIITCCLSVIVDAVTGGWYQLSPEDASVSLMKVAGTPGPDRIDVAITTARTKSRGRVAITSTVPGVLLNVQSR
jgi:hypothetical protein